MRIVCYRTLFLLKLGKMSQNLSSAAVVIGALRVKVVTGQNFQSMYLCPFFANSVDVYTIVLVYSQFSVYVRVNIINLSL